MTAQEERGAYKIIYTGKDGEIKEICFWSPVTLKNVELFSHEKKYLKFWGLKKSISQLDDATVRALIDLSGLGCDLSDVEVYASFKKFPPAKMIDLTKPRSSVSEKEPEKVIELKPRRRSQPTPADVKRTSKAKPKA
jgi:hypothetical protein